jgi:hypothetical protein
VREPYEGCPAPIRRLAVEDGRGHARADRYPEAPPTVTLREQVGKARERMSGGIPARFSQVCPGRAKTQGSIRRLGVLNTLLGRKGLSEGSKPRSRGRPERVVVSATAVPVGETACGCFRAETFGYLSRGERSEGQIP